MQKRKILILGEAGGFTRRIGVALAHVPEIECVLGLERTREAAQLAQELGVGFAPVTPGDPVSLREALAGVFAVINLRGPFEVANYPVAEHCADLGVHYLDPADGRDYVNGIERLARRAERSGSLIVAGASVAPAVSAALVELLAPEFDEIREIHVFLTPGLNDQRELATVRSVLSFASGSMRIRKRGRWKSAHWSTRPEKVDFPAPVGRRLGYLSDLPDLDLFPRYYDAQTVIARAGLPSRVLNVLMSVLSWLRHRGAFEELPRAAAWLIRALAALSRPGGASAGLRVLMRGTKGGEETAHVAYLIARAADGPAIAAAPLIALVKKWVRAGVPRAGALPCIGLLSLEEIKAELLPYDIVLVRA